MDSVDAVKSVLLAHPNTLILQCVATVLQGAGFRVTGQATTQQSLREMARQLMPDIILMDWDISPGRMDVIRGVIEDNKNAIVIIFTRPHPTESFLEAIREGVRGCLSVNLPPPEFLHALTLLTKGDIVVSRDMVGYLRQELAITQSRKPADALTDREREVLGLVGKGATNREIAVRLFVSEHTVKVHLRSILGKLCLRNRQQAAAYAERKGLAVHLESEDNAVSPS